MLRGFGNLERRKAHLFSCLALMIAICCSATAHAQLTANLVNTPGPSGGARLGNLFYIYAKNPTNSLIQYRTTDGTAAPSNTWTVLPTMTTNVYPAAAQICNASLVATQIAVFARRNTDGHLMISRTSNGTTYTAWVDLGVTTDAAPTACWFKPNATTGGLIVFYRNPTTQRCDYKISPDGVNWTAAPKTVFTIVNLLSAPTVVIRPTLNNAPLPYLLAVFFKGPSNVIYRQSTGDLVNWGGNTSDSSAPDSYACRPLASPAAAQSFDPTLTSNIGSCITEGDPTSWLNFHLPQINRMRAGVVKFQTTYNRDWQGGPPAQHGIPFIAIDNCISAGVKTIVFRTAETRTSVADVQHFLSTMIFPGTTNRTIAQLPDLYPTRGIEFVIEVGNEPEHVSPTVTAVTARTNALAVAAQLKPMAQYAKFRWICSLPTAWPPGTPAGQFNYTYLNDFVAPVSGKSVLTEYQGVGVHAYTNNDLSWNNSGERPLTVLEYALARLPYGKMIHVSEIGLNSRTVDWATKGLRYKNAMYAAPSSVHAWEVFCTSAHAQWNTNTHYCLDKIYSDKQVTAVTPGTGTTAALSKITFATTPTFPVVTDSTTWAVNDTVALGNVVFGNPSNPGRIDGVYLILGTPAPGANFFWINRDTRTLGALLTTAPGPGWTDRYPLWSVGAPSRASTSAGTLPAATAIGAR